MKSIVAALRRNGTFLKSVATLMTGKSLAFAIGFAATPIVARLFDPADFGRASFFISVITVLSAVSTLRFERAAVLPDSAVEGAQLIRLSMFVLAGACIGLLGVGAAFWLLGLPLPLSGRLGVWVWALPFGLAILSLVNVCEGWLVRVANYRIIATSDVARAASMAAFRVAAGAAFGTSTWALIGGYLVAFGLRVCVLLTAVVKTMRGQVPATSDQPHNAAQFRELVKEYRDFPVYNAPAGFVRSFADNVPVIMLGYLYSPVIVGYYAMASRIVRAPLGLAAAALRRVYLQRAAQIANEGRSVRGSLVKTLFGVVALGIPPFTLLWLVGEDLFVFVLGDNWRTAGRYAEMIAPWLFSTWIISAPAGLMVVLRRQPLWLKIQIGVTGLRLCAFAMAYFTEASAEWALAAFVNVSVAANAAMLAMIFSIVAKAEADGFLVGKDREADQ